MRRLYDAAFHCLFVLAAFAALTGGCVFLNPSLLAWARAHPAAHRLAALAPFVLWVVFRALRGLVFPASPPAACQRWLARLWEKSPSWLVWVIVLACVGLMGFSAQSRHHIFESSFDLAVFDQGLWNTTQGRFLFCSLKGGICLLGDHFSPLMLAFVPLYYLWDDAAVLLWAQAVLAGAGMLLVYRMALEKLEDRSVALAFVIAYALYLPMRNALRFDFHPEILSDFLWLAALWALWRGRMGIFVGAYILAALGKENMWGVAAAMGAYVFLFSKRRALGSAFMLASVALFFLCIHAWIPTIAGRPYQYIGNFSQLWEQAGRLFSWDTAQYLVKIFFPLGFLSLLSPATLLLALPVLGQNLLSKNPFMHSIFFQYTFGLTCFVFAAAVMGLARWQKGSSWIQRLFPALKSNAAIPARRLAVWMLCSAVLMAGVGEGHVLGVYWLERPAALREMHAALRAIPPEASVFTHEFYAPHLTHRKDLIIRESREAKDFDKLSTDFAVLDGKYLGANAAQELEEFRAAGYTEVFRQGGFRILRGRVPPL